MDNRKVKGTMVLDLVRLIRGNKDRDFSKYLTTADWEIINKRILPSEWYPLEFFQRCGVATFKVLAQENLDLVRFRGKIRGKELFENVYKSLITPQDPMTTLSRFVTIYGQFFNFSTVTIKSTGKNRAEMRHDYDAHRNPGSVPYCYQLMGILDVLVELAGGKNVKIELAAKQWEGAPATTFDITWE